MTNLEIFSPTLKINNNQKLKIKVNNKNEYFFTKIKKMSKNFQIIKIQDGRVKFNNQKKLNVNNLNAVLKGKDNLSANGKFDLDNLNSKIIFDFFEVRENQFDLIMQKKISGKNKLDFSGKVVFFQNDYAVDGKIKSEFLNLDELLKINEQFSKLSKNNHISINANNKSNKKVIFNVKKLLIQDILLDDLKFTLINQYPHLKVQNFESKFENSKISGLSLINLKTNKVNGELNLENFYVKESYFGKTKYDLLDGQLNCNIKFNYLIGKYENNFKGVLSNGICKTGKIKLKGLNIDSIASNVDNIKDFSTLVKTINPKIYNGSSLIDLIKITFLTENGNLKIEKGLATHKNVELNSYGNIDFVNDNISIENKAFFKTNKFKRLPPLGVNISGKISNYKIEYDFEPLKQELFNKGVEKILKEKKSIIIDPNEIKKMFKLKNIDPNKILDLFSN